MSRMGSRTATALVALALIGATSALILSKSELQTCERDGSVPKGYDAANATAPPVPKVTCAKKLVVTLTVAAGQDGGAETLVMRTLGNAPATSSVVANPDIPPAVSSLYDPNAVGPSVLKGTLSITVERSPVFYVYPLYYLQNVNNAPYEFSYRRPSLLGGLVGGCKDGWGGDTSCGYAIGIDGQPIWDSQGFCCQCSFSDQIGINKQFTRGGTDCGLFNSGQASAHCLRFDDKWYSAFSLGDPLSETLVMGGNVRGARTSRGDAIIYYVGDFVGERGAPFLQDRNLLMPFSLVVRNDSSAMSEYMLVPKSDFALEGKTCNKIGVSYTAFKRDQPNACTDLPGSCLANQPKDFRDKSMAARAKGVRTGNYFLEAYGDPYGLFDPSSRIFGTSGRADASLGFRAETASNALITMELSADDLTVIEQVSSGRIVAAHANDFMSTSTDGSIVVTVQNTGYLVSMFYIFVPRCHPDSILLTGASSYAKTLKAYFMETFNFRIATTTTLGDMYSCDIYLYDSRLKLVDNATVTFTANSTKISRGPQDFGKQPDDRYHHDSGSGGLGGLGGFFDFITSAFKNVWGIFVILILVVVGIAVARRFCTCCKSCCGSSVGKDGKRRSLVQEILFVASVPFLLLVFLTKKVILCFMDIQHTAAMHNKELRGSDSTDALNDAQPRASAALATASASGGSKGFFDGMFRSKDKAQTGAEGGGAGHELRELRVDARGAGVGSGARVPPERPPPYTPAADDLLDTAVRGGQIFFNFTNTNSKVKDVMEDPGSAFSLAGRLRLVAPQDDSSEQLFLFDVGKFVNQLSAMVDGEYVRLEHPRTLDSRIFSQVLTGAQAAKYLSRRPKHFCVNW